MSFVVASAHHVGVGDTLHLELQPASGATPVPVTFHVVGVDAAASEFPPEEGNGAGAVWATPAFVRAHRAALAVEPITVVRLVRGPADVNAMQAELSRLGEGKPAEAFAFASQGDQTQHSIHLEAIALWVLAGLLALAGILVVAQLFARQSTLESTGFPGAACARHDLRSDLGGRNGPGRADRLRRGVGRARHSGRGFTAVPPRAGGHRRAATRFHPRFSRVDYRNVRNLPRRRGLWGVADLACGSALVARDGAPRGRRTTASARCRSATRLGGAPVTVSTGIAFALGRSRGGNAIPLRTTLTAAAIGVAALTAAIVFSASLTHLVNYPEALRSHVGCPDRLRVG